MKISYCYPEVLPSRAARSVQVVNTCFALAQEVEVLILFVPQGGGSGEAIFRYYGLVKPPNITVCFVRKSFGPIVSHKIFNFFLKGQLLSVGTDIFFTRHLQTAKLLIDLSLPFIFESHEIFAEKKKHSSKDKKLEDKVYNKAGGIVFVSRGLEVAFKKRYAFPGFSTVVPNSAKRLKSFTEKSLAKGKITSFVYVGTTRYGWKGVDVLIQALDLLPHQYSLEVVGELDQKFSQREQVKRLIREGRLVSRGYLQSSEVFPFMTQAHVAVIPNSAKDRQSAYFTSPLKLIEAMASGIAVVVSDLPSMREIVANDEALLVQPDNPVALAEGIQLLLEEESLRNKIAERGWIRSKQYSWQQRAKKIVALASQVVTGKM